MSSILVTKLVAIGVVLVLALIGGLLPIKWYLLHCTSLDSARTISFTNSFAAGLFLGVGLFHILPEAVYDYDTYKNTSATANANSFPIIFFITACSYTFILFLDRVLLYEDHAAFHDDDDHHHHQPDQSAGSLKDGFTQSFGPQTDPNEESSLLIKKAEWLKSPDGGEEGSPDMKGTKSHKPLESKKEEGKSKLGVSQQLSVKQANFSPSVIFVALTLHALFEGIAIGLEDTLQGAVNLVIAITIHKWAEALALGARLVKSRTEPWIVYFLMGGFCLSTPIGIVIGISLLQAPLIWSAIFEAISAGTFLYLSATEIAVEEFGVKKDRYWKFMFYTIGLLIITIATILD